MRQSAIAVVCVLFAACVFAKPGPRPIPKPAIELAEAVVLAKAVHDIGKGLSSVAVVKPSEYMLIRVQYIRPEAWPDDSEDWRWEVEFVHPVYSAHRAVYGVDRNKAVVLKSVTE